MTKRRKSFIAVFAAVMAIALAAAFLLFSPVRTAFAARGDNDTWTEIGEIYNDSTKSFNEDNLNKLYGALKGEDSGTFDDVKSLTSGGSKTSDYFRNQNGGKNISVWFGGKKWDVVYLTTAQNSGTDTQKGDVILDLWQSADTVTTTAQFNVWTLKPNYPHSTDNPPDLTANYPSNMYSTSQIRVEALNAGGYYSTDKNTLVGEKQGQKSENQYARFTMSTIDNSLTKYIAKPSEVGYQATEFDSVTAKAICNGEYYLPNDAYGTPSGGKWYSDNFGNYYNDSRDNSRADEAKYGAWQNDYLWLPSITEAGCGTNSLGDGNVSNGMWNTDDSLRSTEKSGGTTSTWLRSGFFSDKYYTGQYENCYYFVYILGDAGTHADWTNDENDTYFVRPALHLNLTKAASSVPTVSEIYNDESNSFDPDNMKVLYTALTGEGEANFGKVATAATGVKTSADFRNLNGKNVTIMFGGIKWDAVYLTTAKNGDIILDLWQSADTVSATLSKYANRSGSSSDNPTADYPDNMYSTSLIRVQTLNAGGYMSTSGSALAEKTEQSTSNKYARFTMSSANKSLVQYIVQPKDVAYQETENAVDNSSLSYTLPNDAYGDPANPKWYQNGKYNYAGKGTAHNESKYETWQNDYLWLPSLAETGNSDTANQNGLWKTDKSLRSTVKKGGKSSAWLRSGYYNFTPYAYPLDTSGNYSFNKVSYEYLVRPALHLNLTAINKTFAETVTAEWESKAPTTFYTTGENLLDDIASKIEVKTESGTALDKSNYTVSVDGGSNQIITADSYTLKITLNSDDYQFADGTNSATLTAKVEEAKVRVSKGGGVWGFGSVYYASEFVSPMTDFTVTLCENVDDEMFLVKADNGTVTFDLNGKTFTNNIDVDGGTLTLTGSGTVNGEIYVQSGKFNLDGSYVKTVKLEGGTLINVQSAPTSGQITIIVDNFDTPYKVLTWTGDDPTEHFRSFDENACFYKGTGENAAYIGKHSFVFDGEPTWTEPNATFSNIHCEHENCSATASATVEAQVEKVSASCTTENITYTATVNLSNLQPAFDPEYAAIKGGTITKTKTINGSEKETPTHEWTYSADGGKLTATCNNPEHKEDTDGKKTFTVNVAANDTPYNGATHPAAISGDAENFPNGYSVAYKYKGFSGADFQNHDGEPKNAGYYQVIISASSQSATLNFEIKKATLTIKSADVQTKTYDGTTTVTINNITFDGIFAGDESKVQFESCTAAFASANASDSATVNFTSVTLKGEAKGNYTVDAANHDPITGKIEKATLKITGATVETRPYNGTKSATITEFIFDGYKKEEDNAPTAINVAEYTAEFKSANVGTSLKVTITSIMLGGTAAGNYAVDLTSQAEITGEIEQATANVTIDTPQNAPYNGAEQPATVSISVTGAPQLIESDYTVSYKGTVETNTTPKNADTYTVTVTLTGNAATNYKLVGDTATFTIAKAELAEPTGTKILNETYNTYEHTIEISNFVSDKMTAKLSDNTKSSFVSDKFTATKAGEYTLTITITDQSNYKWKGGNSTDEVVFTIKIAKATVDLPQGETSTEGQYKPESYKVTISGYDNALMKFATTGDGAEFNETEFTAKNVGKYTLTISLKDTDDYEWADKASDPTFTINISKKELEKPTGSASGAYNGRDYVVELANYDDDTMKTSPVPKGSTFEQKDGKWQFSARDFGTYSITISLKYTENYKWIGEGADPTITITIGKTQLSFTLQKARGGYNGKEHTDIDVNFEGDYGHLAKGSDYELSFAAIDGVLDGGFPKGAGSYTVTLTLKGTAAQDYDLGVTTATYTIDKADITFELIKSEGEYTGATHSDIDVNFTGKYDEFTKDEDYTLVFEEDGGKLEGSLPKGAGGYNVKVNLSDEHDKNYNVTTVSVPYKINKAKITVSGTYSDSRDYNGGEYSLTLKTSDKNLQIEMPVADPEFSVTVKTARNAGRYAGKDVEVTYEYDETNFNLDNSAADYEVEIFKAKLTLSLTVVGGGKTYDGYNTAAVTGVIDDGIFGGDDVSIAEIIANFKDKNVGENKPVTVTKVTLGGTEADNYTVDLATLPEIFGKIAKRTVEVVWSGYSDLIYDGNLQTITASATGVTVDGSAEEIILSIAYVAAAGSTLNEDDLPQNAGTYTATASTLNGNYELTENSITYTVAKRQVIAPTIASVVYNGNPQTAQVALSALYSAEEVTKTNAGDYPVAITLIHPENYKWTTSEEAIITVTFTIEKAVYNMSGVTFDPVTITYDGEEHSILIGGDLPLGVEVTYDGNGQKEVGEYPVTAYFTGDGQNYELIPEKTATLTILAVSHDLSAIAFGDVTVKYDGEAHSIYIVGVLPTNVTVDYEGNGQVEPNIYTVTAIFSDPDGVFDTKTATLTILRTQTQTAPAEEGGGSGGSGSGGSGSGGAAETDVYIESEEGFDPTLELVVEKIEDVSRNYWAWGKDKVSEKYAVKLCKDGEEVPIDGKVTVRLLIPEAFRDKNFELMALAKSGAASASYSLSGAQTVALGAAEGEPTSVKFTRDGDYVIFETDGLSEYVFTSSYEPYFPILILAAGILIADVLGMVVLTVVIKKKLQKKVR